MEETKQKEPLYSSEPTKTTGPDSLRSTRAPKESSETQKATSEQSQTTTAVAPKISQASGAGAMEEFAEFLKRTKNVWLIAAGAVFGLMVVVTVTTRKSDWVFLSMKDQSGTGHFDTPQAKIAALPCIDSRK